MYSREEANTELSRAKLKKGTLIIEGPETLSRPVPEIPATLLPGQYRFQWEISEPGKEKRIPVSGEFLIEADETPDEETPDMADPYELANRIAAERLADREAFYRHMLQVNSEAQERIEKDRERTWNLMEARLQGMQKIMQEQVKNTPQQVTVERPERREWWEAILEKHSEDIFPIAMQVLSRVAAKAETVVPAAEVP